MGEPKFTKGPWEAHTSYDELWGDDVWYQTEYHSVMANGNTIASDVSSKENAALIASAPELYDMLQKVVNLDVLAGYWDTRNNCSLRESIEKLLKKARGEE